MPKTVMGRPINAANCGETVVASRARMTAMRNRAIRGYGMALHSSYRYFLNVDTVIVTTRPISAAKGRMEKAGWMLMGSDR